jgi:uncharacterized protein YkwD
MLLVACMTFMLAITSVGGAYVSAVYAAPVDGEQTIEEGTADTIKDKKKEDEKAALGGLLLIGLVSMLKKGSDGKSSGSDAGKSSNNGNGYIPTPQPTQSTPVRKGNMSSEELQLVNYINTERAKQGLTALKANNPLADVARAHSQDMADKDYFEHYNLKGQSPFDRMRNAGISFRAGGENIAINVSVPAAHKAFMNSPGHRANVLSADYTEVGVGIIHDGSRIYVAEEFIGR